MPNRVSRREPRQRDRRRGHAGRRRTRASDAPGTLAPDEVYGLVAWILAGNGIVARDAVMNAETLPAVEMPARGIFIPQER